MSAIVDFIVTEDLYEVEKPYSLASHPDIPKDGSFPVRNFSFGGRRVAVTDIRTLPPSEQPTLERHGFCWVEQKATSLPAVLEKDEVIDFISYEDEMGGWVKDFMGAHMARSTQSNDPGFARAGYDAHCDTSKDEVWPVACRFLTQEELHKVKTGQYRMRVVHVWRPVGGPVQNYPLAAVDGNTVWGGEDDFYKTDVVSPWFYSESLHLKYSPDHRWLYKSKQVQDEVLVFSQHDTHPPNNLFPHIPHAALKLDDAPPDSPPRRSIDMRFVVLGPAPPGQASTGIPFELDRPLETREQPWKGRVSFRNVSPPRYILPVSKTHICRLGPVSERLERFVAKSSKPEPDKPDETAP